MQKSLNYFQLVKLYLWLKYYNLYVCVCVYVCVCAYVMDHNVLNKISMLRISRKRQGHENHYYHNPTLTFTSTWLIVKSSSMDHHFCDSTPWKCTMYMASRSLSGDFHSGTSSFNVMWIPLCWTYPLC